MSLSRPKGSTLLQGGLVQRRVSKVTLTFLAVYLAFLGSSTHFFNGEWIEVPDTFVRQSIHSQVFFAMTDILFCHFSGAL